MLSRSHIRDILTEVLLSIRELSRDDEYRDNIAQIRALSDLAHNIPTLLYEWDMLETSEPGKRDFLFNIVENEITEYIKRYPDSSPQLIKYLSH